MNIIAWLQKIIVFSTLLANCGAVNAHDPATQTAAYTVASATLVTNQQVQKFIATLPADEQSKFVEALPMILRFLDYETGG
jgi:hypothetical protein